MTLGELADGVTAELPSNNISGVYAIKYNKEIKYVGSSINIRRRICSHIRLLNRNKHHNKFLQKFWNTNNKDKFSFGILEQCNNRVVREKFFIDKFECSIFNIIKDPLDISGENHPRFGSITPQNVKDKISKALVGRKNPLLSKINKKKVGIKNPFYGKKHNKKTRELMSNNHPSMIGEKNNNAKLNNKKVRLIKHCLNLQRLKPTLIYLANIFCVKKGAIYDIERGKSWKHIKI